MFYLLLLETLPIILHIKDIAHDRSKDEDKKFE